MAILDLKEEILPLNRKEELIRKIRDGEPVELSGEDLSGADLMRVDLSGQTLVDTNLSGADLVGADLSGSDLAGSDLSGADLTKANLAGARLWNANLVGAKLVEADLSNADLWQANLCSSRLWRAELSKAKSLTKNSFHEVSKKHCAAYKIHEDGYISAEETYRNLKRHFINEGRYNDASWASFKEKTMEKMNLWKKKDIAFIPVAIMGLLCGYGEKPLRIILSSFFVIFSYAALFNHLKMATAGGSVMSFGDYLYYSIVTFTTLGYGDIIPKVSTGFRLLAASEAFVGVFLMGLFIFTLARRYSAR